MCHSEELQWNPIEFAAPLEGNLLQSVLTLPVVLLQQLLTSVLFFHSSGSGRRLLQDHPLSVHPSHSLDTFLGLEDCWYRPGRGEDWQAFKSISSPVGKLPWLFLLISSVFHSVL